VTLSTNSTEIVFSTSWIMPQMLIISTKTPLNRIWCCCRSGMMYKSKVLC